MNINTTKAHYTDNMAKYTTRDEGCYADGCHGHVHIRLVLAELLAEHGGPLKLARCLEEEMSDDAWEEEDALNWLNNHVCEGVLFGLADGDLLLLTPEKWNEVP
jgi:hypothetical protein